jgi:hypothetical protein
MLKKIITIILFVGFTGVLVWGGINRTLAKTGENETGSGQGRNQGAAESVTDGETHGQGRGSGEEAESHSYENEAQASGSQGNGRGNGAGQGGGRGQGGGNASLEAAEIEALETALADEYHALALYQAVVEQFGAIEPFTELVRAEGQHIAALTTHFTKYDLAVPENTWLGTIPAFESVEAACQAGAAAEQANVELYDTLLSATDDTGLLHVFQNLQSASLENHLPELEACQ